MQNFNKNTSPQGAKGIGEKHKFINKDIILIYVDYIIILLIISYFIFDILRILSYLISHFYNNNVLDFVCNMVENSGNTAPSLSGGGVSTSTNTTTTIIHTS